MQKEIWEKQKSSYMRNNLRCLPSYSCVSKISQIKEPRDKYFLSLVGCWPWSVMWLNNFALLLRTCLAPSLSWVIFPFAFADCTLSQILSIVLNYPIQIQQRCNTDKWYESAVTYNMKSCSQEGSLPLLSIVVLFKLWTFKTT